jgi:predicted AlkP superfamily pyrophosphatase or phosphodiesterase
VRGVLPTVTYSSHTTLITGVSPATHGIVTNRPFEPERPGSGIWYWYTQDIRVPTLWDAAARAGHITGSVSWPVSVGADAIRYNMPEYARTRDGDDLRMVRGLATPGLMAELEKKVGPYTTDVNQAVPRDWVRTRYAAEMIRSKRVRFMTVHLAATDHFQHRSGPFSPVALQTVEEVDKMIGVLRDAILSEDANAAVCVVSDHGFAAVDHLLKLDAAFVKAGLITLKSQQETVQASGVAGWTAMPWESGGSAAVVLKDRNDDAARARVAKFLDGMASDAANGIAAILDRKAIAKLGGASTADFWVDMRPGFAFSSSLAEPLVTKVTTRGTHGYSPEHPELASFFLIAGKDLRKGASVGEIDMRSIAPTIANLLGAPFPTAEAPAINVEQ